MKSFFRFIIRAFHPRGLVRFVSRNLMVLCILLVLLASGAAWLISQLPPLPGYFTIGEPSLVNPGDLDFRQQRSQNPGGIQSYSFSTIFHTIDPDDVVCPVIWNNAADGERIDLFNLESQTSSFLAIFTGGVTHKPIYRPEYNEILILNSGMRNGLRENLYVSEGIFEELINLREITRIHRFSAADGAYLGQLELPLLLRPVDVSPDGRLLLVLNEGLWRRRYPLEENSNWDVVDLTSGQLARLPFGADKCFFESSDTLLLFSDASDDFILGTQPNNSVRRFWLKEKRLERLYSEANPPAYQFSITDDYRRARRLREYLFVGGGANQICSISLDGKATFKKWEPYAAPLEDLTEIMNLPDFQPDRMLAIVRDDPSIFARTYNSFVRQLTTGAVLKTIPQQVVERLAFLNKDYVWLYAKKKSRIVLIDDFLDESFEFEPVAAAAAEADK